jgi:hypothetical protein
LENSETLVPNASAKIGFSFFFTKPSLEKNRKITKSTLKTSRLPRHILERECKHSAPK